MNRDGILKYVDFITCKTMPDRHIVHVHTHPQRKCVWQRNFTASVSGSKNFCVTFSSPLEDKRKKKETFSHSTWMLCITHYTRLQLLLWALRDMLYRLHALCCWRWKSLTDTICVENLCSANNSDANNRRLYKILSLFVTSEWYRIRNLFTCCCPYAPERFPLSVRKKLNSPDDAWTRIAFLGVVQQHPTTMSNRMKINKFMTRIPLVVQIETQFDIKIRKIYSWAPSFHHLNSCSIKNVSFIQFEILIITNGDSERANDWRHSSLST